MGKYLSTDVVEFMAILQKIGAIQFSSSSTLYMIILLLMVQIQLKSLNNNLNLRIQISLAITLTSIIYLIGKLNNTCSFYF